MSEDNNEKKIGGSSFKFMTSGLPAIPIPRVMPADKRKSEFALTMLFTQLMLSNGYQITKIELNENDENKGADTIIKIGGIEKGIQITKLVMNDLLMRKNVGIKRSYKIAELITENLNIDFKLNVVIHPPNYNSNEIPQNKASLDNALALKIRQEIESNLDSLKNSKEPLIIQVEEENIKKIASIVFIMPIPVDNYSAFPGKNNIHVNYEFDNNSFTYEEVLAKVDAIYNRKNSGSANFLLIWADKFELLYQDKEIFKLIEERFSDSSFEKVFFLTFFDRMDLFGGKHISLQEVNKKVG